MKSESSPNLLLEALTWAGRRAAGRSWAEMQRRISLRGALAGRSLCDAVAQLNALDAALAPAAPGDAALQAFFGNLEGFGYNTIGSASPAFLLLFPFLEHSHGDPNALRERLREQTPETFAGAIAGVLEESSSAPGPLSADAFLRRVLALPVPDASRVALLQLWQDAPTRSLQALDLLLPVLDRLQRHADRLQALCAPYVNACAALPESAFFDQLSHLRPAENTEYLLHPFVFGADTNLISTLRPGQVCIYGGILRRELMQLVNDRADTQDQVCEFYRLLGDSTRFDILCYLRRRSSYVQELSQHFGLSRNTIHHHMNKLMDSGLVHCTVEGNRSLYTLDQAAVQAFVQLQTDLFCL